jgi:transposase
MINNHGVLPSELSLNLSDCTVAGSAPTAVATCGTKGVFKYNGVTTTSVGVPGLSSGHSNNVLGKIDYHLNDQNSINDEYFFGQAITITPNTGVPSFWNNLNVSRTQMMRAVWSYVPNSNWVNDVRFGHNRYNLADGNAECVGGNYSTGNVGQPNYKALGFISGANPPSPFCGFPAVNFNQSGYPSWGAGSFFIADQGVFQYTCTAYDNASYTHGSHNFKFGFEFHHSRYRGIGHRAIEFRKFLNQIDRAVPADLTVHLVLDNYATHKTKEIRAWFLRHPRYHLHFTPTHSSWLNQVERWFALLSQRQIKRGSHYSVRELESAILEFIEVHNEQPKPFAWTKSADASLNSIGRFASRTLAAHGAINMQEISDSGD